MLNYVQDKENINDTALTEMLKDAAVSYKAKSKHADTKKADSSSFSAIIKNLGAKVQKAQTNFVDKVAKTNISSINKKVVDNASNDKIEKYKSSVNEQINLKNGYEKVSKNEAKSTKKQFFKSDDSNQTKSDVNKLSEVSPDEINETTLNKPIDNNIQDSNKKSDQKDTKVIQSNVQKLSDINDNSYVEPSPVFLENTESNEPIGDVVVNSDNIVQYTEIALLIPQEQANLQNKDEILDEVAQGMLQADNIENVIEEISQMLDGYSLTKENEEDIKQAFEKIKEIKQNSDILKFSEDIEINNNNAAEEIKLVLSNLSEKLLENGEIKLPANKLAEFNFNVNEKILLSADYSADFKKPEPVQFEEIQLENKAQDEPLLAQEVKVDANRNMGTGVDESGDAENQNKIQLAKNDVEKPEFKMPEIKSVENDTTESIKTEDAEVQSFKTVENIEFEDEQIEEVQYDDEIEPEEDFRQEVKLKDKIALNDDNGEDIELTQDLVYADEVSVNENKNVLSSEIQPDDNTLALNYKTFEDKTVVKNDIEQTTNGSDQKAQAEPVLNNVKSQTTFSDSQNQTFNNENQKQNQSQLNNTEFEDIDLDNLQAQQKSEIRSDDELDILKDVEIKEENIDKSKLYAKVEQNSSTEDTRKTANIEKSLEKMALKQEQLDEMLVSMSRETVNNGALTVADEVAKIAINEDTSITSPVNVVYDNAGKNVLLKNIQALKAPENIFNHLQSKLENSNILDQIAEKFDQIKSSVNQKLTMVLRPHDLGRLSIELTNGLKGLITNIVVQNQEVKSYIEGNINALRNQLAAGGVNVNQIQIKVAGSNDSSTYNGNQNLNHDEARQDMQEQGQNREQQDKKQMYDNEVLLASLANFDVSFANDFSSVLSKTIGYGINE